MEEIILLIDYKAQYGIKYNAKPYRSGLDIALFTQEMKKHDYLIKTLHFFEIDFSNPQIYKNKLVLYQSAEAYDYYGEYKSYIDDVLFFLKISGAILIPEYKYFRAHGNKVFMEMLRGFMDDKNKPSTDLYGSFEEFIIHKKQREFPVVVKKAFGDQSRGVFKASSFKSLKSISKKIARASRIFKEVIKDRTRLIKYNDYQVFSLNRNKFLIQSFIPELKGDYKILIFRDIFFVIERKNRPNDFRASGGGYNSFAGEFNVPDGLLEYAYKIFSDFNCPFISLDIGINNNGFNLIEFQFINFGTSAHSKSEFFYRRDGSSYLREINNYTLEYLYSYSLCYFLRDESIACN